MNVLYILSCVVYGKGPFFDNFSKNEFYGRGRLKLALCSGCDGSIAFGSILS